MALKQAESANWWEGFERDVQEEIEQSRRSLKEVSMMLEQSQAELAKLTQRNQTVTSQLRQVQVQIDSIPKAEIRAIYDSALDAQHRLLVMRGQLEKLQSDRENIQRYLNFLEKAKQTLADREKYDQKGKPDSGSEVLEMVMNSQEAVRQRLSNQMHDGPAQALSNFILRMDIANRMMEIDPTKAKEELADLKLEATRTFAKVKSFISELRPMILDDLGIIPTLNRYVVSFKEQTGLDVTITVKGQERRFEPYLEVMVFRAVQELMGNTLRHNQDYPVKLAIHLSVSLDDNQIKIVCSDNGKGFDTERIKDTPGLGLKLIRERVEMLGGTMEIESSIGQGCKVSFSVPILESSVDRK